MSTEQALYQSVLDAPDDDAPRLVFADWLEENGQPERAEFIRVQLAQEREPELSPRRRELEKRARALLKGCARKWARTVKGLSWEPQFRRGFVESVCTTAKGLVDRTDELFALAPLRSLRVTVEGDTGAGLAGRFRSPVLRRLRHLCLGIYLTAAEVAALAGSPHADGLRELGFVHWGPRPVSLRDVFQSARLGRVEALELRGFRACPESPVVHDLAASPLARQLVRLQVTRVWTPEEARALVESPALGNLRSLRLLNYWGGRCTGPQIAGLLAGSALLPRLHTLGLESKRIGGPRGPRPGDDTARTLARSPGAAGLRVLDLSDTTISDAGARALLESPHLGNLWWLGIRRGGLSPTLLKALRQRFGRYVGTVSGL